MSTSLLDTLPLLVILVALVLYTVLAGADFGAGLWQLGAGSGTDGERIREHAHHSNAPIWEANHVWLILVLTVLWTCYPVVFASVASTMAAPLLLALFGIVLRGLGYVLQSVVGEERQRTVADLGFGVSSILTPFMLGAIAGGIATGRVPVGNAAGDPITSWLNPVSVCCGLLAVGVGAFLAAVYLAADAARFPDADMLTAAFRRRALISGIGCGVLAILGLLVVAWDGSGLFHGLTTGWGLVCVLGSGAFAVISLALVWTNRFARARLSAALAVAGILGGWAAAQRPDMLPGLTLAEASAGRSTMIAVVVSVIAGGFILFPSLAVLFRLELSGDLDPGRLKPTRDPTDGPDARRPAWAGRAALACLVAGVALLTIADADVAHGFGVVALAGAAWFGFTAVGPDQLALRD